MADEDEARLDYGGDFAEGAAESVAAGDALASSMIRLQEANDRVKDPKFVKADVLAAAAAETNAMAAAQAKIAAFDGPRTRALHEQEQLLRKMREDATGITAENEKQAAAAAKKKAADEAKKAKYEASRLSDDERAGYAELASAGAVVAAAAGLVLAGAAALTSAAWALEKAGVESTTRHEIQGKVGEQLGGSYDQSVGFALHAGLDPEKTWQETKRLLSEKFNQHQAENIVHISAGMDIAGQNGDGLVSALSRIKLESKSSARDVESLRKLGIDAKDVYSALARTMGTDVATATAKVKHGLADSQQVIDAITQVAGGKYGSMANVIAGSVPALVGRIKGDFGEMFDFGPGALDGVKDVLHNIADVFEGPGGQELKASAKEVFEELNHAFLDEFRGDEGKEKIKAFAHEVSASLHEIADVVHEIAPAIKMLENLGAGSTWNTVRSVSGFGQISDGLTMVSAASGSSKQDAAPDEAAWRKANGYDDAADTGHQISGGIAQGIRAGQSEAVNAAGDVVDAAIAEARSRGKIHSPSEAAADEVGDPLAEGMALGMSRSSSPAAAGRQMAADALAGARGSAVATGGSGGAASTSAVHEGDVYVTVQVTGDGAARQWQAMLPDVERAVRRMRRDRAEGART